MVKERRRILGEIQIYINLISLARDLISICCRSWSVRESNFGDKLLILISLLYALGKGDFMRIIYLDAFSHYCRATLQNLISQADGTVCPKTSSTRKFHNHFWYDNFHKALVIVAIYLQSLYWLGACIKGAWETKKRWRKVYLSWKLTYDILDFTEARILTIG